MKFIEEKIIIKSEELKIRVLAFLTKIHVRNKTREDKAIKSM